GSGAVFDLEHFEAPADRIAAAARSADVNAGVPRRLEGVALGIVILGPCDQRSVVGRRELEIPPSRSRSIERDANAVVVLFGRGEGAVGRRRVADLAGADPVAGLAIEVDEVA